MLYGQTTATSEGCVCVFGAVYCSENSLLRFPAEETVNLVTAFCVGH